MPVGGMTLARRKHDGKESFRGKTIRASGLVTEVSIIRRIYCRTDNARSPPRTSNAHAIKTAVG